MSEVSSEQLSRMAAKIANETGAHLFVKISDKGTPHMNWHTVTIPRKFLSEGHQAVFCLLLHEWGHRTMTPGNLEHAIALALELSNHARISLEEAAEIVNIACDLWVDDEYVRSPGPWGDMYVANLSREVESIRTPVPSDEGELSYTLDSLIEALIHVLVVRARINGRRLPSIRTSATAQRILKYLYDECISEHERIHLLYDDLRHLIGPKWELSQLRQKLIHLLASSLKLFLTSSTLLDSVDLHKLAAEINGINSGWKYCPTDLLDGKTERINRLKAQIRRLKLYPGMMRRLERVLLGRHGRMPEGWTSWAVGDRPDRLDVSMTYQRGGELIPGVTTVQTGSSLLLGDKGSNSGAHICLIIDDSYSTEGKINDREVEMALGVIETAKHFGDLTSLVVFGSEVTCNIEPSTDYEKLSDTVALLESRSGGTSLLPALNKASAALESTGTRSSHVMIITDSCIADLNEALPKLQMMANDVRVSFFCFESQKNIKPFVEAVRHISSIAVYASPVGDGFCEDSITEIIARRA